MNKLRTLSKKSKIIIAVIAVFVFGTIMVFVSVMNQSNQPEITNVPSKQEDKSLEISKDSSDKASREDTLGDKEVEESTDDAKEGTPDSGSKKDTQNTEVKETGTNSENSAPSSNSNQNTNTNSSSKNNASNNKTTNNKSSSNSNSSNTNSSNSNSNNSNSSNSNSSNSNSNNSNSSNSNSNNSNSNNSNSSNSNSSNSNSSNSNSNNNTPSNPNNNSNSNTNTSNQSKDTITKKVVKEVVETYPVEDSYSDDPTLRHGAIQFISSGSEGSKTVEYEITYTNGVETSRSVINTQTIPATNNEYKKGTMRSSKTEAQNTLSYVNALRTTDLQWSDELSRAALIRAEEIATSFSHTRPDGTLFYTVSQQAHGENIQYASYDVDAKAAVDTWINSPGHLNNMKNSSWVSYAAAVYYHNGSVYWVQLFGGNW
ncbi:hypothetical protein AOC36_10265 [Erysipelothrix larvae]|uniref:G5 domain-containing protein n=1 Tax=Erysipelothrix larvae TaxID=1514105 RepID=A0A0X8H1I1_9FIRM|nr:G5 domain-containing protein [Erysipelothrix larvae]AMC94342.1 hypothetical protein AOC36_10265 [Erysipelothrix larvae]